MNYVVADGKVRASFVINTSLTDNIPLGIVELARRSDPHVRLCDNRSFVLVLSWKVGLILCMRTS